MSASDNRLAEQELRSFGRKRGRKLSPRQQELLRDALPRVALDLASPPPEPLDALFSHHGGRPLSSSVDDEARAGGERGLAPRREIWLEIGFGGAEHMIWQASRNPNIGIIGCEPFQDGIVKALSAIEEGGLSNVRLHGDDARPVVRWLPRSSLDRVFILFPDPWPKKRHQKRRLVSRALLDELARVMKPGAELRFATDVGDYARTALLAIEGHPAWRWIASHPADWRQRPPDWPQTRYEAKAIRDGRRAYFFRFMRV